MGQGFVFVLTGDGAKILKRGVNAADSQTELEVCVGVGELTAHAGLCVCDPGGCFCFLSLLAHSASSLMDGGCV